MKLFSVLSLALVTAQEATQELYKIYQSLNKGSDQNYSTNFYVKKGLRI